MPFSTHAASAATQPASPGELHDLYLNLLDQISELARRHGGLRRILDIPRGKAPRTDHGYFEQMTWAVFKSGLNRTVMDRKWPRFRQAFSGFSVPAVAAYTSRDVRRLVNDPGIIRYRAKIEATILNAREMVAVRREHGSFRRYLRSFAPHEHGRLYQDLRRRFRHLGPHSVRTFLRRVGQDVFFVHPDGMRVLYRLGLITSPRASDEELARAHSLLQHAVPGSRIDEINRLIIRFGSGHELDEAICADRPLCHRCALTHWCWYYAEVRGRRATT